MIIWWFIEWSFTLNVSNDMSLYMFGFKIFEPCCKIKTIASVIVHSKNKCCLFSRAIYREMAEIRSWYHTQIIRLRVWKVRLVLKTKMQKSKIHKQLTIAHQSNSRNGWIVLIKDFLDLTEIYLKSWMFPSNMCLQIL